ncbi:unnamed protein product [Rhodiola kirilowii]
MTYNFMAYLKQVNHMKLYMFANVQPIRMDFSWQTENNGVDCGVFAMRHMETFKWGGNTNWNTGVVDEGEKQTE